MGITKGHFVGITKVSHLPQVREPASNTSQGTKAGPKAMTLDFRSFTRTWTSIVKLTYRSLMLWPITLEE